MKKSGLADSPFFSKPSQPQEVRSSGQTVFETPERKTVRNSERTENRTASVPGKRRTKRYSFEFYEDQITQIKRLKYEAEMAGQRVNLSDFAREAFDLYLDQLKK